MKNLLIVALILVCFTFTSILCAGPWRVEFTWTANTESDLAGYRLYQGTESGVYEPGWTDIQDYATSYTVDIPDDGVYFWVLTAYDNSGNESEPSAEVTLTLMDMDAPAMPADFDGAEVPPRNPGTPQ